MHKRRVLTLLLCLLLTAVLVMAAGCGKDNKTDAEGSSGGETVVMGEGEKVFDLTVSDLDGSESRFEIHTDKTTVGEALMDLELIDGEAGVYGLYVKTVNGITADYDKDGSYWACYVHGEYSSAGVDMTDIVEGDSYALKVEKA